MSDYRLVMIEWVDSTGAGQDWNPLPEKEVAPIVCRSAGWLVVDGDQAKVIVPHIHESNEALGVRASGCGDMTIPARAVLRMVELREV